MRASLEVADIFRAAGRAYRTADTGHLSLHQLKVMSVIEHCRTAVMGGHVEACTDCGHWRVAHNYRRNRHCPRCQGSTARMWLAKREADLFLVGYFYVVFTLPAEVAISSILRLTSSAGIVRAPPPQSRGAISAGHRTPESRLGSLPRLSPSGASALMEP